MMRTITAVVFTLLAGNVSSQMTVDEVFQAHSPDGMAYWVVVCTQADKCLEDAYKWCNGPYKPLDGANINTGGFRFLCKKQHKESAPPASQ
jgi:hypothetical protein